LEGGKLENPEKNPQSKGRANNELDPYMALGQNQILVGYIGERQALSPLRCAWTGATTYHYTISALLSHLCTL